MFRRVQQISRDFSKGQTDNSNDRKDLNLISFLILFTCSFHRYSLIGVGARYVIAEHATAEKQAAVLSHGKCV